jgi:hypothetical protein
MRWSTVGALRARAIVLQRGASEGSPSRRERHQCENSLSDALADLLDRPGTIHFDQYA